MLIVGVIVKVDVIAEIDVVLIVARRLSGFSIVRSFDGAARVIFSYLSFKRLGSVVELRRDLLVAVRIIGSLKVVCLAELLTFAFVVDFREFQNRFMGVLIAGLINIFTNRLFLGSCECWVISVCFAASTISTLKTEVGDEF